MKRLIAALLTVAMVVSFVPFSVLAEGSGTEPLPEASAESTAAQQEEMAHALESTYNPFGRTYAPAQAEEEQAQQATDTTDVQLSGNGVLGNMLADRINTLTAENGVGYSPDYGITDIVMDGSHATVTYKSAEAADLVVACYTEDTQEMVTSGTVRVAATADGTAELTIENVPAFYVVKGFLLNEEHAPLCNAYTKSLYTEAMDQIKQATTKDFEEDRVLNLDQNLDTNFMVVGEDVSLMQDETSTVYADEDNQIYRFTNPGEELTSLKPGDVFVYEDDLGGFVVAKVKEITWEGNTLVITGDPDFDPSEAFDVIKVDDAAEAGDFIATHDENTGVPFAYDSIDEMENDIISFDEENSAPSGATTITGGVTDEIPLNDKTGGVKSIYGKIGYSVTGSVTYYFRRASLNLEYLQLKAGAEAYLDGGFTVSTDDYLKIPLGHAQARLAAGTLLLEIDAAFKMQVEVTGSVYLKASAESMITWENGKKDEDNTKSTFNAEAGVKLEGKIYAGISLTAAVTTMGELLKTEAELSAGSELTLTLNNDDLSIGAGINMDKYDSKHSCAFCVDITGERNCILTVSIKIWKYRLLENGKQTGDNEAKWTAFYLSWPMDDAYYSSDHDEFGWGSCPYRSYKVVVTAKNANGQALNAQGVKVYSRDADGKVEEVGAFDAKNTCKFFLPNGTYTIYAALNDSETYQTVTVDSKKAEVELRAVSAAGTALSGTCGENVNWKLTTDGQLIISGSGAMYDYGIGMLGDTERAPWIDTQSKHPVKNLVVCEGVTHIGGYAFMGCTELESVEIADSVTSIGSAAFSSCESLISVSGGKEVSYIGTMAFTNCKALPAIELSNKLEGIEFSTFSGCESLQFIALPSSIEYIGMNAFKNCKKLTDVVIPGSVEFGLISNGIFEGCENLKSAAMQRGVTEIPQEMFKSCTNLETIDLPDTVKTIAKDAFVDCTKLKKVGYLGSEDDWEKITVAEGNEALTNAERSYTTEKKTFGSCGSDLTWTLDDVGVLTIQGTGRMDDYSQVPWDTDKVQKVIVKNGVLSIGAYAFYDCPNLTAVQLPAGLYEIGNSAFAECPQLNSVQLPSSLTTLGDRVFRNDSGLLSINLPDSLTSIGARAFEGCRVLQSAITMPHNIVDVPRYLFYNCYKIPSVQLADSTQSIGEYAFRRCEELKSIKIPESVTSIGAGAFEWCSGLTEVVIPDGVTRIEDDTFKYSYNITSITLPKNLVSIGDDAFNQTKITSMELPESVIEIGDRAFMQTELTGKFVIPSGVTEIGKSLFEWCQELTEVVIPDGITSIGAYAFYNTGITSFVIPDGVRTINDFTFYGTSLDRITIPVSVTMIGNYAFDNWYVKEVCYTGTKSDWSKILVGSENEKLNEATIHCTDGDILPTTENSITTGTATKKSGTYYAAFENAKAGKEYVVLVSRAKYNPFGADNLIYINQITAGADGELSVPFRTAADTDVMVYVVACAQDDVIIDPDQPDTPSGGGGGGGAGAAIAIVGGVVAVAAVAGVVLMMPVEVSGTVKCADQAVLPAAVQVLQGDKVVAETVTDAEGRFTVKVRRGSYTLRVRYVGADGYPVTKTVEIKAPSKNMDVAA